QQHTRVDPSEPMADPGPHDREPAKRRRPDERDEYQDAAQSANDLRPDGMPAPEREEGESHQHESNGQPEAPVARRHRRRDVRLTKRVPARANHREAAAPAAGLKTSGIRRATGFTSASPTMRFPSALRCMPSYARAGFGSEIRSPRSTYPTAAL